MLHMSMVNKPSFDSNACTVVYIVGLLIGWATMLYLSIVGSRIQIP